MAESDLHAVALPKLSPEQAEALGHCPFTKLHPFRAGDQLFASCERDPRFFVMKSGKVEIIDKSGDAPKTVTVHGAGEFTGDVGQVTGRPAVVSAIAKTDGETYEQALRDLLNNHRELGDPVMQAFVARGQLLTGSVTFTGRRVIGSRYSQGTFRVRDFLSKNRVVVARAAAVPSGNQPGRGLCRRRCPRRVDETRPFRGGRGVHGGSVRP